jgi:hypothetical protein
MVAINAKLLDRARRLVSASDTIERRIQAANRTPNRSCPVSEAGYKTGY